MVRLTVLFQQVLLHVVESFCEESHSLALSTEFLGIYGRRIFDGKWLSMRIICVVLEHVLEIRSSQQLKANFFINDHFSVDALVGEHQLCDDGINVIFYEVEEIVGEVVGWTVEGVLHPKLIGEYEQLLRASHHVIHQFLEKVICLGAGVLQFFLLSLIHRNISQVLQPNYNINHFLDHRVVVLFFSSLDNVFDIIKKEFANITHFSSEFFMADLLDN